MRIAWQTEMGSGADVIKIQYIGGALLRKTSVNTESIKHCCLLHFHGLPTQLINCELLVHFWPFLLVSSVGTDCLSKIRPSLSVVALHYYWCDQRDGFCRNVFFFTGPLAAGILSVELHQDFIEVNLMAIDRPGPSDLQGQGLAVVVGFCHETGGGRLAGSNLTLATVQWSGQVFHSWLALHLLFFTLWMT